MSGVAKTLIKILFSCYRFHSKSQRFWYLHRNLEYFGPNLINFIRNLKTVSPNFKYRGLNLKDFGPNLKDFQPKYSRFWPDVPFWNYGWGGGVTSQITIKKRRTLSNDPPTPSKTDIKTSETSPTNWVRVFLTRYQRWFLEIDFCHAPPHHPRKKPLPQF